MLSISILEEPLTVHNVTMILSVLNSLATRVLAGREGPLCRPH